MLFCHIENGSRKTREVYIPRSMRNVQRQVKEKGQEHRVKAGLGHGKCQCYVVSVHLEE